MEKDISIFTCFRGRTTRDQAWQEKGRQRIACWPVFACHACVTVVIEVISKVCAVYSISFSSTQRLGGHIPQDPEAHNKSKTQTTQSLTRSIPSLSRLFHQQYSRRPNILNIDSAWSRACISFHPPRPLHAPSSPLNTCREKRVTLSSSPANSSHPTSATSTQSIV